MRILAIMLFLVASIKTAHAAEPLADVPFKVTHEGNILIETMVNGHGPYDFIVDTGSTITLAFQNLSERESFSPTGGPPLRILSISGAEHFDAYRMGEISVGAARLSDHVGVLVDDWEEPRQTPAGVIGLDFLKRYTLVFNVGGKRVKIYKAGDLGRHDFRGWKRTQLNAVKYAKASETLYTARSRIRGRTVTFLIDIGSGSTMINYNAASALFAGSVNRLGVEGTTTGSRLKDVFDDRKTLKTALIEVVTVGSMTFRNAAVWVFDAPIFEELGVQRLAFGLFGADLALRQDFALDFGENAIYFAKPKR